MDFNVSWSIYPGRCGINRSDYVASRTRNDPRRNNITQSMWRTDPSFDAIRQIYWLNQLVIAAGHVVSHKNLPQLTFVINTGSSILTDWWPFFVVSPDIALECYRGWTGQDGRSGEGNGRETFSCLVLALV